ncbi:MAG: GGDEF domain-containing protein, partial [Sphingomonadaceae bacterium]|nr:GGDEF domain-containing protein [Sphingomonadaceae bacterium]
MERETSKKNGRFGTAERDLVALGIAVAAIIMFVGTGSSVLPQIARSWAGNGAGPDTMLANALILNIALILFGWRRYVQLTLEIGERRKAEEKARRLAETDPLTGTLNRRSIGPATNILIEEAKADGQAVLFAMIDLDNFKLVNDLNGHKCGDHVLRVTADRIRDSLPEGSLLSRLGGDEFACAVRYDPAFPEEGEHLALQLIDQVSRPIRIDDTTLEITMSVGLAATTPAKQGPGDQGDTSETNAGEDGTELDGEALMHKADIAMYHAKKRGRNGYFWFEPRLEIELHYRNQLEAGIRRGITLDEFVPYYEQQVDIVTGELLGFEMLARWHSPNLGVVSPEVFIPIA